MLAWSRVSDYQGLEPPFYRLLHLRPYGFLSFASLPSIISCRFIHDGCDVLNTRISISFLGVGSRPNLALIPGSCRYS